MGDEPTTHWRLVVGDRWRLTGVALLTAGVLILIASVVEYRVMTREITGGETPLLLYVRETFRLAGVGSHRLGGLLWVPGYVLVIGLAAIHAYFNAGYLPSVLLAVSPNIGIAIWAIHGVDEYVAFMPWRFVGILPEGLLVATLGFLLGLGLRRIRNPNTPARPAEPAAPER